MPPIQSPQMNQQGQNLDKVLVLTKNDLERITNHINRRQIEEDSAQDEQRRKRELYEKSQALTRNWNNTIEVYSISFERLCFGLFYITGLVSIERDREGLS